MRPNIFSYILEPVVFLFLLILSSDTLPIFLLGCWYFYWFLRALHIFGNVPSVVLWVGKYFPLLVICLLTLHMKVFFHRESLMFMSPYKPFVVLSFFSIPTPRLWRSPPLHFVVLLWFLFSIFSFLKYLILIFKLYPCGGYNI